MLSYYYSAISGISTSTTKKIFPVDNKADEKKNHQDNGVKIAIIIGELSYDYFLSFSSRFLLLHQSQKLKSTHDRIVQLFIRSLPILQRHLYFEIIRITARKYSLFRFSHKSVDGRSFCFSLLFIFLNGFKQRIHYIMDFDCENFTTQKTQRKKNEWANKKKLEVEYLAR